MSKNERLPNYLEVDSKKIQEIIKNKEPEKREDKYPPSLQPKKMKLYKLKKATDIKEVDLIGRNGDPYVGKVCQVLNLINRKAYSLWLGTILQKKFDELNIETGDVFGLVFKGLVEGRRVYRDYAVFKWDDALEKHLKEKEEG